MYALDYDAPARLRDRVQVLADELAGLHAGQQTIMGVAAAREQRDYLVGEIRRAERALLEASESLGADPDMF
jgi:hypothetical protein